MVMFISITRTWPSGAVGPPSTEKSTRVKLIRWWGWTQSCRDRCVDWLSRQTRLDRTPVAADAALLPSDVILSTEYKRHKPRLETLG